MRDKILKVRNQITGEIYYTNKAFKPKEIDGVKYLHVKRNINDANYVLMKKDVMEYIEER